MIIYNIDDTELLDAIITEGAEHEEELMKSDFIKFSFSADVRVTLPVGAYIVFNGLKYRLSEPYQPSQESEVEFKYEPLFHHPKMWLGKVVFVFDTTDTAGNPIKQQVWDYNGFTGTLLQYVVDAINEAFGFAEEDKFNYTVIGEVDNTVSVSFSNTDILSAISAIASACKDNQCEWHLDWEDKSLYFGQLAYNRGEETPILKVGENVGKASVSTSNDGYYNVFRPEGSTRNMSIKAASGENVSTGIRLRLNETDYPDGKIYVSPAGEIITEAAFVALGVPAQTLGLTFDDVYPHVDLYAYNIRKRTRYLLDDSGKNVVDHYDGENPIYKTYTVWYMRLAYPTIVGGKVTGWTDYTLDVDKQVLDGYKPMVTFKANTYEGALSSSLAGQPTSGDGFEIVYHNTPLSIPASETTGDSGVEVLAGDYEIVFVKQGENDMIVPTNEDAGLIPRGEATPSLKGNIVVLYNIAMGANEVLAAQQDLLNETKKEIARRFSDLNNYTVSSYPHVFEKSNPNLYIGQRVTFDNGNGYQLNTRVIKLVTKLDYDFIQTITVGNQQIKGSISQLKEDVKTIMSGNFSGAGINQTQALNLIKNYVGSRYLSKLSPDTAQGVITFLEGLTSQEVATFFKGIAIGTGYGIDAEGVARLRALLLDKASIDEHGNAVVESVKSQDFYAGLLDGRGFGVYKDDLGNTVGEIDKLNVRKKAVFAKLEVREFAFTSGDVGYTSAGCRIERVTRLASGDYRCYWLAEQDGVKIENAWHVGDQAMARTVNIISRETSMAANRYYWRLVVGNGEEMIDGKMYHYVDLSDTRGTLTLTTDGQEHTCVGYDTSVENDAPQAEDSIVQMGSQTDEDRQYAYVVYVSEGKRVDYDGINDYDLDSHIVEIHSREVNYMRSERFELVTGGNIHVPLVTERGAWTEGTTAYHYDHFSYNNATWLCIVGKGQSTTEAPNEESGVWIKETYGADGRTSYLHIAYATNATGEEGFSVSDPTNKTYIGQYVDFAPEDSEDPKKYTWMLIKGADGNDTETYTLILSRTGVYDYETDSVKVDVLYTKGATSLMLDKNSALSRKTYVYVFDGKEAVSSGEGGTSIDVGSSYSFKTLCPGGQYVTIGLIRSIGGVWTLLESKTISVVRKGEDGAPGKDAVTVRLVPDKVVVDTDTGGHVTAAQLANAVTTVEAYKGGAACAFTIGTPSASSGIGYTKTTTQVTVASISDDPSTGYAYGSGYVDIPVTVDGVVYTVRLTVETNIHKVVSQLKQSTTEITASVSSLTQTVNSNKTTTDARLTVAEGNIAQNVTAVDNLGTRVSNVEQTANGLTSTVSAQNNRIIVLEEDSQTYVDDIAELYEQTSTISQKADKISLKVSETVLKGNLLAGTMFRREEEVTWNNPAYKGVISTAVQLGGVNSVYLESVSETQTWKGVKWTKIPVTAWKTYNMSFWYRTPDAASNGNFTIEVQAFKADGTHAEEFNPLVNWQLPIPANDTWELYSADMTVGSDVASVNVYISLVTKGKMYIARPMLIEGSYVGWQRSEQDYDYIGGNLLDETKTLTKRGNLTGINGTVTGNAFGWCSAIYAQGASPYTDILTWRFDYDLNADYTLSFMAKGTGNLELYLFNDYFDVSLLSEFSGQQRNTEDGNATIVLTPEWKRHTVRWRTMSARTWAWSYLQLRVWSGNEAYISQPKLEKGCTATEWTDGDGDMVSTKALLATGIDIENRKVVVTADNVYFQNNAGDMTAMVNAEGKIKANFVEARNVTAMEIAQPFESYASLDDFKAGSSMSWRITGDTELNKKIFNVPTNFNGGTVNIYNVTSSAIVVYIPLLLTSGFGAPFVATIELPAYCLFRALAIQGLDNEGIDMGFYPLVPLVAVTAQSGDIGKRYRVSTFLT
jgi:hypothetical protein